MGFTNRDGLARLAAAAIIATAAVTAWLVIASSDARGQAADVTVRGCVERDAAASAPIYKLVTAAPAPKIYRLSAPKEIDIASHVGHTVDITGTVSADPPGRSSSRESELAVKKLVMVNSSCGSGVPGSEVHRRAETVPANSGTSSLDKLGTPWSLSPLGCARGDPE